MASHITARYCGLDEHDNLEQAAGAEVSRRRNVWRLPKAPMIPDKSTKKCNAYAAIPGGIDELGASHVLSYENNAGRAKRRLLRY